MGILSRYKYTVTYHGIDGLEETFEGVGTFQGANPEMSFQFISDYINAGKWEDETHPYERVFTVVDGFHSEPLLDAVKFYRESVEGAISHRIGIKCTEQTAFAECIMDEAAKVVKTKDKSAKMEWTNTKRRIRECQKRGKPVYRTEYAGIAAKYHLYTITDFSFEPLE